MPHDEILDKIKAARLRDENGGHSRLPIEVERFLLVINALRDGNDADEFFNAPFAAIRACMAPRRKGACKRVEATSRLIVQANDDVVRLNAKAAVELGAVEREQGWILLDEEIVDYEDDGKEVVARSWSNDGAGAVSRFRFQLPDTTLNAADDAAYDDINTMILYHYLDPAAAVALSGLRYHGRVFEGTWVGAAEIAGVDRKTLARVLDDYTPDALGRHCGLESVERLPAIPGSRAHRLRIVFTAPGDVGSHPLKQSTLVAWESTFRREWAEARRAEKASA